jgi:hypothetical protein
MELWQTRMLADPPVEAYPFADARGALRAIAERRALGKVVLSRSVEPYRAGGARGPAGLIRPAR